MKKLLIIVIAIFMLSCEKDFPSSKHEIGRVDIGTAYGVKISGNNAYVGNNDGVVIIDIANPEKPEKVTTLRTNDAVFGIFIEGNTLFSGSSGNQNLRAYDISNPNEAVLISSITFDGIVVGICKNESNLFVATQNGNLLAIDVTDLTNMNLIKIRSFNGQGQSIVCNQNYIYFANAKKGLLIIDVSDPENPTLIETMGGTQGAWALNMNDNYLCLSKHSNGFNIYFLDNPALPHYLISKSNGGESYGICNEGNYIYVADLQQGIEIWDAIDMENPVLLETIDEYTTHGLTARDDLIFLADQDRGFVILRY